MLQKFSPFASGEQSLPWGWFGIAIGIAGALTVWWRLTRQSQKSAQHAPENREGPKIKEILLPEAESPPEAVQPPASPDDLTRIEGIGPKINTALQAAGLTTFAQLAAQDPAAIKQILREAGIRLGDPTTWPEQAALAAAEAWDELQSLQAILKGGRRV